MPKISVIVPVYNVEPYLRQCVDSILNQTFTDFELLLVDDGSTDRSGAICDEYTNLDARVKVFHTTNRGVSAARNLGIDKASAEWITFIDSDDWVENNYLSVFFKNPLSQHCIVFQRILLENEKLKKSVSWYNYKDILLKYPFVPELVYYKILHNGFVTAKLYNRIVIQCNNIRFHEKISMHEDLLFVWTYLCYIKEIQLYSSVSYHYMKRERLTLSSQFHSSEEYVLIVNHILNTLNSLCNIIKFDDILYLRQLYNSFILPQILRACKNVDRRNYAEIFEYARMKKKLFDVFLHNKKNRIYRFFLSVFFNRYLPDKFILILCIIYRKFIIKIFHPRILF